MSHEIPGYLDSKVCRYGTSDESGQFPKKARLNLKILTWMELYANADTSFRAEMRDVCFDIARFIHGFDIPAVPRGAFSHKFALSDPYHHFLTSVAVNEETSTQHYSVSLYEIIDSTTGELCDSLHINFYVDLIWLVNQYMLAAQDPKMTVLYQYLHQRCLHDYMKMPFDITTVEIKMPQFGCHHPKISVLKYADEIRILISSANIYAEDWTIRTQELWISPLLSLLPKNTRPDLGESPTNFKKDFVRFLDSYQTPEIFDWLALIQRADFSSVNVFFVASVPGHHAGPDLDVWGHKKLAYILSHHVDLPKDEITWPIVAQSSALGVFGYNERCWLVSHIVNAMAGGKDRSLNTAIPEIKVIFPSVKNYHQSYDAQFNKTCLMYNSETHSRQLWMEKYLHQWKSDGASRTSAMPHSKSYTRISPDGTQILWFVLTSANLSKSAWGKMSRCGSAQYINNYEAGVVFIPKFIIQSTRFLVKGSSQRHVLGLVPPVRLRYDRRLAPFDPEMADDYNPGFDSFPEFLMFQSTRIPVDRSNGTHLPQFQLPYDWPLTPYDTDDEPFTN
ncbi:hypothetical protein QAD02_015132 [Eretmocerus hayati]|uniref:Uncharacterized protein n=1 Tax=Eretmocerus hayati TaxID=131215 RepID=A0ACC2P6X2_9HYME|nr:hypothetical protein QAD02_015132 [Eretmocerus hayati]